MAEDDDVAAAHLAAAAAQVVDELLERGELGLRGQVAVEIADKADAERDVVQVIAVDVAAVDLARPAARGP